jgi:hypothetical protein
MESRKRDRDGDGGRYDRGDNDGHKRRSTEQEQPVSTLHISGLPPDARYLL